MEGGEGVTLFYHKVFSFYFFYVVGRILYSFSKFEYYIKIVNEGLRV